MWLPYSVFSHMNYGLLCDYTVQVMCVSDRCYKILHTLTNRFGGSVHWLSVNQYRTSSVEVLTFDLISVDAMTSYTHFVLPCAELNCHTCEFRPYLPIIYSAVITHWTPYFIRKAFIDSEIHNALKPLCCHKLHCIYNTSIICNFQHTL